MVVSNTAAKEVRVNTDISAGKYQPDISALKNGGFVCVWSSQGQDGSGIGVYGQRFGSDGMPVGREFRVNTKTVNDQNQPSVAGLNDGGFVVTWTTYAQDGGYQTYTGTQTGQRNFSEVKQSIGVFGQRYDAGGNPVGTEFRVNTTTAGDQDRSQVAALSNGGFVVTWASYAPNMRMGMFGGGVVSESGESYRGNYVYFQRYNPDGTTASGEDTASNSPSSSMASLPWVAGLSNGGFVIAWYRMSCHARVFNADGSRLTDEFSLSTSFKKVAGLSQGGFVIVGDEGGVVNAEIFGADGSLQYSFPQLITTAIQAGEQTEVCNVTGLSNGDFVVVWNSYSADGSLIQLRGQRYSGNGAPVGSEFLVSQKTTAAGLPAITTLTDGRVAACWLGVELGQDAALAWLPSQSYDTGTFSSFDFDELGNCLETHVGAGTLYYRVGTINQTERTIIFGTSTKYDSGTATSVALAQDGNFIEVHSLAGKLYSRVAKADFRTKTITWKTGTAYQQYETGTYCGIVVDKQNNCLEIHTSSSGLFYRIGKVDYTAKTINWSTSSTLLAGGTYTQCSLTMDAQGNCLATATGGGLLYAYVGQFTGGSVAWGQSKQFNQGSLTSVSLASAGNCIETHTKDNRLYYCLGKLDSVAKTVTWGEAIQYSEDNASKYSFTHIACDSQGKGFEIHVIAGSPNRLYYRPLTFTPPTQLQPNSPSEPNQIWATIR
jgi:hypothetical protein